MSLGITIVLVGIVFLATFIYNSLQVAGESIAEFQKKDSTFRMGDLAFLINIGNAMVYLMLVHTSLLFADIIETSGSFHLIFLGPVGVAIGVWGTAMLAQALTRYFYPGTTFDSWCSREITSLAPKRRFPQILRRVARLL